MSRRLRFHGLMVIMVCFDVDEKKEWRRDQSRITDRRSESPVELTPERCCVHSGSQIATPQHGRTHNNYWCLSRCYIVVCSHNTYDAVFQVGGVVFDAIESSRTRTSSSQHRENSHHQQKILHPEKAVVVDDQTFHERW